ncbi:glycosyltransferase [Cohnella sp. CFH 77786]|uniref:glycosyltransferase family 2 protein n=1 Tax=Cohnella sp. CFH 77786 TaxID=2662265 RepID=UPI001C60DB79|nr:glycosyltransferase family 2 protein [Cohnella sp. CFH 77786]MBW5448500.1 glycosyltransferase [Cohnella sp. CFH 77786]
MTCYENPLITILLSTYNGQNYLRPFLDSLLEQTFRDFLIIVRDDGSTDNTLSILQEYTSKFKNLILLEEGSNVGAARSFGYLLEFGLTQTKSNYFMFADQDDVWMKDKIEKTYQKMQDVELQRKSQQPILVHTDLMVTGRDLNLISSSFWKQQKLRPTNVQVNKLLIQNVITGCTMMINRRLAEKCSPFPKKVIMHDWWIGLVASCVGEIVHLQSATILYRLHDNNHIGARKLTLFNATMKLFSDYSLEPYICQCNELYRKLDSDLTPSQRLMLINFAQLNEVNYMKRVQIVFKWKFFKSGFFRNIAHLIKM